MLVGNILFPQKYFFEIKCFFKKESLPNASMLQLILLLSTYFELIFAIEFIPYLGPNNVEVNGKYQKNSRKQW